MTAGHRCSLPGQCCVTESPRLDPPHSAPSRTPRAIGVGSSWARAIAMGCVSVPAQLGVHVALVPQGVRWANPARRAEHMKGAQWWQWGACSMCLPRQPRREIPRGLEGRHGPCGRAGPAQRAHRRRARLVPLRSPRAPDMRRTERHGATWDPKDQTTRLTGEERGRGWVF